MALPEVVLALLRGADLFDLLAADADGRLFRLRLLSLDFGRLFLLLQPGELFFDVPARLGLADVRLRRFLRRLGSLLLRRLLLLNLLLHLNLAEDSGLRIVHLALRNEFRALIDRRNAQRFIRRDLLHGAAAAVFLVHLAHRILGRRRGYGLRALLPGGSFRHAARFLLRQFADGDDRLILQGFLPALSGLLVLLCVFLALRRISAAANDASVVAHVRRTLDGINRLLHALFALRAAHAADRQNRDNRSGQRGGDAVKHIQVHMLGNDFTEGRRRGRSRHRGRRRRDRRRGRHGGRRRGRRQIADFKDVGGVALLYAGAVAAGDLELELAGDARLQIKNDGAAFARRKRRDLRHGRARLKDGQVRRIVLADVLNHHAKAQYSRFAVDDVGGAVSHDVQNQRIGRILRRDLQLGGHHADGLAAFIRAGNGSGQHRILRAPEHLLLIGSAGRQLHAGNGSRAVAEHDVQAGIGMIARILERKLQRQLLARVYVLAVFGGQLDLQAVLGHGDRLARHIGNGQALFRIGRLIGDRRLAHQLLAAHGERIGEGHLLAHGQRSGGKLLLADAIVFNDDVAQLDIAGVGERIGERNRLSLACADGGNAVRRSQARRSLLGLDRHGNGAGRLGRSVGGIDGVPDIVLDLALVDLIARHVPLSGIRHALFALQAAVFLNRDAFRIKEGDLLLHIRLAAVVNLDGDGNLLFGDHRLRLAERRDTDRIRIRHRAAAQKQHEHGHDQRQSAADAS